MSGPWLRSAARSVLDFFAEGAMWMGLMWTGPPYVPHDLHDVHVPHDPYDPYASCGGASTTATGPATVPDRVRDHPDQPPTTPLSSAERAAWAALLERLR